MKLILFCFFLFPILFCQGQDEHFFRKFLFPSKENKTDQKTRDYIWQSLKKTFHYDINGDGLPERLMLVKRDQEDWFYLYKNNGDLLIHLKFEAGGRGSHIYRVKMQNISPDRKLLILYHYEGFSDFKEFYGAARIYFLTFNPDQIKGEKRDSFRLTKGPSIWQERRGREGYYQGGYRVKIEDLDGNGLKEVVVYRGHTQRIFGYFRGKGMVPLGSSVNKI